MRNRIALLGCVALAVSLFLGIFESNAWGRDGGGRSFGGGSSRSFSTPYGGLNNSAPRSDFRSYDTSRQSPLPATPSGQAWAGGGFFRGLAGGLAGGFLGSLLFSSLGYAAGSGGVGGGLGGGIGLLEILLLAGAALALVAYFRRRQQAGFVSADSPRVVPDTALGSGHAFASAAPGGTALEEEAETARRDRGLTEVRAIIPDFDATRFQDEAMDIFFRIQGAWAARDLRGVRNLLGDDAERELQRDLAVLQREGRVNRLENIAVRRSAISEAWTEARGVFVTVHFLANLLDFTVEEATDRVVAGSRDVPAKFEEDWTFARSGAAPTWKLVAI